MELDSVSNIINKAVNANIKNDYKDVKNIILSIKENITKNIDLFINANEIDLQNENGFKLDFKLINKILDNYSNTVPIIQDSSKSVIKDDKLYSKIYTKLGIVLVIFDGNTYTMLELILLSLLTHNTMIFTYSGYMGGTNGLLINIIQSILEKNNLNRYMFQHSVMIRSKDFFKNYKTIDKTIIIGNNDFISKYMKESTTDILVSGYKNYDIYIDSINDLEVIKNILALNLNINLYVNSNLKLDYEDIIYVNDIEEAITYINYNSSKYASAIFTTSNELASKFIREINSKNIFVNSSPTLEQKLDIDQIDLLKEKNILMPNIYKFDGKNINIKEL